MSRRQRLCVAGFVVAVVLFGVVVEWRSAFMRRRMTDVGCYLRAAWAARVGTDLYGVTDDNLWHYNYPPFLAICLVPFADAPRGQPQLLAIPYSVSVALWYAASVAALVLAVHWLASALEHRSGRQPRRYGQQWWAVRLGPLLIVLPAAGRTLARGQVNLFVLALLAAWLAGTLRGRGFRAGMCLAAAVCIKVIPAFLLVYPVWRRDRQALLGATAGFVLGLGLVPAVACGPRVAFTQLESFVRVTVLPGLNAGADATRHKELHSARTTDSQSIMTALHNLVHFDPNFRPDSYDPWVRRTHWLAGLALLAVTLWRFRRPAQSAAEEMRFAGALLVLMTLVSPVGHPHYFVFCLPAVAGLYVEERRRVATGVLWFFVAANVASLLPVALFRQYGITTLAALALWAAALAIPRGLPTVAATRDPDYSAAA